MNILFAVVDAIKDNINAFFVKKEPVDSEQTEQETVPSNEESLEDLLEKEKIKSDEIGKNCIKLSSEFSKTVRKMNIVESNLSDAKEQLRQEKEKNETFQDLSVKHAKLSDDFSTTVKRMNIVESNLSDATEQLRQADTINTAFQNTVDAKDTELKEAAANKKQIAEDLKEAQITVKELKKAALEVE